MRKILIAGFTVATLLLSSAFPAFANVVPSPTGGKPIAAYSNSGSTTAQANRSSTGTYNKTTNDGYRDLW